MSETTKDRPQSRTTPKPSAEHRRLELFVGRWKVTGRQLESRVGPAAEITGEERFEWAPGGFFLVHHFYSRVGGDEAACVEITGYDASAGMYTTHTYYNNGHAADWTMRERDGAWTLTGQWPMDGGTMQVRCVIEFADEGNTRTGVWESSTDGARWEPFWDLKATRT